MKNLRLLVIISATALMAACNNEPKQSTKITTTADSPKTAENKIMIPASSCYTAVSGRDTFKLKVEVFPNVVTGKLLYDFYEKDGNNGELDGLIHGDTLLADYKFMSEGKLSARQVIFLLKDSTATEGYGDMEEKDGKMVFKNTNDITFGTGLVLKKAECGEY